MDNFLTQRFVPGLDIEVYHGLKDFTSSSHLKLLEGGKTPAHLKFVLDGGKKKATKATTSGTISHEIISNPIELWNKIKDVPEKLSRNTNEYKAMVEENPGKILLKPSESQVYKDMKTRLLEFPEIVALLCSDNGISELSGFFKDPATGLPCKIRPDFLPGAEIITDYKSTIDASEAAFKKAIINFGYDIQSYFYTLGMKVLTDRFHRFVFVAQEKTPPYEPMIYFADDEVIELGKQKATKHLETIRRCQESGIWPGYMAAGIQTIAPPAWAKAA